MFGIAQATCLIIDFPVVSLPSHHGGYYCHLPSFHAIPSLTTVLDQDSKSLLRKKPKPEKET